MTLLTMPNKEVMHLVRQTSGAEVSPRPLKIKKKTQTFHICSVGIRVAPKAQLGARRESKGVVDDRGKPLGRVFCYAPGHSLPVHALLQLLVGRQCLHPTAIMYRMQGRKSLLGC